jgi:hypothetical protein
MECEMSKLREYIETELSGVSNEQVLAHIRGLLVEPKPVLLLWDYGDNGQQFLCSIVLSESLRNVGIVYCAEGFGPRCPWGLVELDENSHMGMDSGWFSTFLEAYFDGAAVEIPIWCVFETAANGSRHAITAEGDWEEMWAKVMSLRAADPDARYDVDTKFRV